MRYLTKTTLGKKHLFVWQLKDSPALWRPGTGNLRLLVTLHLEEGSRQRGMNAGSQLPSSFCAVQEFIVWNYTACFKMDFLSTVNLTRNYSTGMPRILSLTWLEFVLCLQSILAITHIYQNSDFKIHTEMFTSTLMKSTTLTVQFHKSILIM